MGGQDKESRFHRPPWPWWKGFLIGLALPAIVCFGFAILSVALFVLNGNADAKSLISATQIGIGLGAFASIFGVGELAFGILFTDLPRKDRAYMVLGYLLIWSLIVSGLLKLL